MSENLKLSTNISLKASDSFRYQAMYASQLYGTFFGLFARFHCEDVDAETKNMKKIDFLLINYKGERNLRICFEKEIGFKQEFDAVEGYKTTLEMKVISDKIADPVQENISFYFHNEKLIPVNGQIKEEDVSGVQVKNESQFIINRELIRMNHHIAKVEEPSNIKKRAFSESVFDSEFFIRDGVYIMDKDPVDIAQNGVLILPWLSNYPYGSCTPGVAKVLF